MKAFRIIGIYDAERNLAGELRYLARKLRGKSCALCDITHGWSPFGKPLWRQRNATVSMVEWLHRDEIPDALLNRFQTDLPCILIEREGKPEIIVSREQLETCKGDYRTFEALLHQSLSDLSHNTLT